MYVNRKLSNKDGCFTTVQFRVITFIYGTSLIKYIDASFINGQISVDLYWTICHSESLYFKEWKELYQWLRENKIKRRGRWEIIESPRKVKLAENFHTKLL